MTLQNAQDPNPFAAQQNQRITEPVEARRLLRAVSGWMTIAARQAMRRRAGLATVDLWKSSTVRRPA